MGTVVADTVELDLDLEDSIAVPGCTVAFVEHSGSFDESTAFADTAVVG